MHEVNTMNSQPEELALRGFGQAGKPGMHEVNWRSMHFSANLLTKPPPSLIYMVDLYIDWGSCADNLTPLPLYGNSLSFDVMAESEGNIELMYDPLHGWIPIIDHLHRTNPTVHWCMSHVYDFATLWNRAELAVQQHLNLPRRYFHADLRFRRAWLAGTVDDIKPHLCRHQRRDLKKRKHQRLATAAQVRQPSHRRSEDTGTAESPQQSSIDMPKEVSAVPMPTAGSPTQLESGLDGAALPAYQYHLPPLSTEGTFALPRRVPAAAQSLRADPCTLRTSIDGSRRPRSPRAVVDNIRAKLTDRQKKNIRKRKAQMIEMAGQEALPSGFLPSQEDVQAAVSGGEGPTFGGESSCRSERDDVEGSGVHNGAGAAAGEGEGEGAAAGEGEGEGEGVGEGEGEPGFVVVEDFSALFSGEMAQSLEELAGILYAAQCGVQRSTAAE
jgi:hypothetical protein